MQTQAKLLPLSLALAVSSIARADFSPIPLTPESYTQDIIVEKGATPPPAPATTATMDAGDGNSGYSWYEQGYNVDAPITGLPVAGSTIAAELAADHLYTLATSYTANNAILIDRTVTNATVTLTAPMAVSALSFLASAGSGQVTVNYTVHRSDGSNESGSFITPDWYNGENIAVTGNGRVNVASRALDSVESGNPRLYWVDVALTNGSTSPISSIDLTYGTGNGHAAIFAVSGSVGAGFTPLIISGYNRDLVVESTAGHPPTGLDATTASMDSGLSNTDASWYEQGYNSAAPTTGIPAPGSTLTNAAAADHVYALAPDYTNNNVAMIDVELPTGSLVPITPTAYSALSFLTSAGNGAVVIDYMVNHADGSTETGSFTSPDWFNNVPVAFNANGRVDVVNAGFSAVNSGNPRLYGVDIALTNTTSPVTSIDLTYNSGTGHAVIFAVSGATGDVRPIFVTQPQAVTLAAGGTVDLSAQVNSTAALQFQWQKEANGTFVNLTNAGNIAGSTSSNLVISNATLQDAGNYQLVASNFAGAQTSQVARVTILSSLVDITSPADEITSVGGDSPGAEPVESVIDDTTSKYLNFGSDGDQAAPFAGPAGLVVTPAAGSTLVTGLRIYTANDAEERDPADYKLEGSNDGGQTFTVISEGPLSLPSARNAGGLPLDPLTLSVQEVLFANSIPYTTYRLTFANVKDNAAANSMQVGEIELLGTTSAGAGPVLTVAAGSNNTLTITSSQAGQLQSTTALNGAATVWQDEGPINGSVTVNATEAAKFYRVMVQ